MLLDAVQRDERVADMLVTAAFAASRTSVEGKRRAMGRGVGRAARDDAAIDESQLMLRVELDLDAPEFNVLARIAVVGGDRERREDLADGTSRSRRRSYATGSSRQFGTFGGGLAVVGLTQFGRSLLDFVHEADVESNT